MKIGVFDSGLGGLTAVRALTEARPDLSLIYFADIAHVPYGERPLEEVRGFALDITRYLVREGAEAVVMACNMSSATALEQARRNHPGVTIIGMLEAGARVASRTGAREIGILATSGTVVSGGYLRAISSAAPRARVIQTACPRFVPLIEAGRLDGPEVEESVRGALEPALSQGVRVFILGCTHYPFLLPVMQRLCPSGTVFVDPAREAAAEMLAGLGDVRCVETERRFVLSAPSATFRPAGSVFLGRPLPELELVSWDDIRERELERSGAGVGQAGGFDAES